MRSLFGNLAAGARRLGRNLGQTRAGRAVGRTVGRGRNALGIGRSSAGGTPVA